MARVWFNHWFSTAVDIIALMKKECPDITVVGTNRDNNSVIRTICDEWYAEPDEIYKEKDVIDCYLRFCKEYKIDVFVPHRHMEAVSKRKSDFESIGVKVMADDYDIVSVFSKKDDAYDFFRIRWIGKIPDYKIITNADEFIKAYSELSKKYSCICFKLVKDEGGRSFRVIDNNRSRFKALFESPSSRVSVCDILDVLKSRAELPPIIMMPYLSGDEISIDCLDTEQGLIALPRRKFSNTRSEKIEYDDSLIDICRQVQEAAKFKCPYNVQFKYLDNTPYLLEVNTRMSGGIQMTCYASGVNIPGIALKKLIGQPYKWHNEQTEKMIGQILVPAIIQ